MITSELALLSTITLLYTAGNYALNVRELRKTLSKARASNFPIDLPCCSSSPLVLRALLRIHIFSQGVCLLILFSAASIDFLKNYFCAPACPELTQFYAHLIYFALSITVGFPLFIALLRHLQAEIDLKIATAKDKLLDLIVQSCIFLSSSLWTAAIAETIVNAWGSGLNNIALHTLVMYASCWSILPALICGLFSLPILLAKERKGQKQTI